METSESIFNTDIGTITPISVTVTQPATTVSQVTQVAQVTQVTQPVISSFTGVQPNIPVPTETSPFDNVKSFVINHKVESGLALILVLYLLIK